MTVQIKVQKTRNRIMKKTCLKVEKQMIVKVTISMIMMNVMKKKFMMNVTKIAVQKREASEDLWKTGFEKKLNMKEKNANENLIQTSVKTK